MAKLSDVVLHLLGKAASGVYDMTPPGMMARNREQTALDNAQEQQKIDTQKATSLAHLATGFDFNQPPQASTSTATAGMNGIETAQPQAPQGLPVPGMSGYTMTPRPNVIPRFTQDAEGNLTPAQPIILPRGQKPLITKPTHDSSGDKNFIGNDADGNPLFADKSGAITLGSTPGGGPVLPKTSTMPTAQTRASGEFADTIIPHIDSLRNLIKQADAKGYIGPAAGRVYGDFLAGKVGSTGDPNADNLLGQLRATDSLLKTGAMKVHFGSRGGSDMYDHFSDMLNTGKQSAAMLNGSLNGIQEFMQGYSDAGKPKGRNKGKGKLLGQGSNAPSSGTPTLGSDPLGIL